MSHRSAWSRRKSSQSSGLSAKYIYHLNIYIHTYINTYTHIYIHTYTYIHVSPFRVVAQKIKPIVWVERKVLREGVGVVAGHRVRLVHRDWLFNKKIQYTQIRVRKSGHPDLDKGIDI